jgi:hypothetical protein
MQNYKGVPELYVVSPIHIDISKNWKCSVSDPTMLTDLNISVGLSADFVYRELRCHERIKNGSKYVL